MGDCLDQWRLFSRSFRVGLHLHAEGLSMFGRTRTLLLITLGTALAAMLLLSAGVSKLEFLPGVPAPGSGQVEGEAPTGIPPEVDEAFSTAFRIFVTIVVLGLPIIVLHSLLSPEARKNLIKGLMPVVLFGLLLFLALRAGRNLEEQAQPTPAVMQETPEVTPVPEESVEATAGEAGETARGAPAWLIWGAIVILALILALVLVGGGRLLLRLSARSVSPLAELADQAEEAVEAIRAGADLQDTVMLCYYRMSQTLQEQRGIWREADMTPREFEGYLARSGLPGEPVRRLTRLFEKVRYGAKIAGVDDERRALSSLGAIVEYCRSAQ